MTPRLLSTSLPQSTEALGSPSPSVDFWISPTWSDMHHRNIRLERLHMTNSLLSVRSFSHDLESFAFEQGLQALAHQDMVISEHDSNWHSKSPLEAESRVSFPAPGPNRSRAWLQSRASVPAYRSVPDLFFCNPTAQHERQSPRHRLRWNSTTRDFFGRFESTLGSPWHASWR